MVDTTDLQISGHPLVPVMALTGTPCYGDDIWTEAMARGVYKKYSVQSMLLQKPKGTLGSRFHLWRKASTLHG